MVVGSLAPRGTAMSERRVSQTVYLVLEPTRQSWGEQLVHGFKVTTRANKPEKNAAVVKLRLSLPASVFEPILVNANVDVEEHDVDVVVDVEPVERAVGDE